MDQGFKRFLTAALALFAVMACGQQSVRAQPAPPPPSFATSGDPDFDAWRDAFARRALAEGRDRAAVIAVLDGLKPNPGIIELDQRQPEFVAPVWDYVRNRATPQRIQAGKDLKASLGSLLPAIEQRYGVDTDIVLGIWGLESNYGAAPLNYGAGEALATLAFEGRRRESFELFLLALIEMVEKGYAAPDQLKSSWAGALGQPQFMPDIYLSLAVDWDGDGHRDIWSNPGDVAASISHYLAERGWRRGQPVFDEVTVPSDFDYALADGQPRPVEQWAALGIAKADGAPWSESDRALNSQLFFPAGAQGPALMLHPNFGVIRRYNASDRYALAVALLARGYADRPGLIKPWPMHLGSLNRDEILELQTLLNGLSLDAGTPDGLFGSRTRVAVRQFQASIHQPADGFPTSDLLAAVREKAGVAPPPPPAPPRALDRTGIRQLQRLLNRLGYPCGTPDGRIGPTTRDAIRAFERSRHMPVRGRATTTVLEAARRAAG